MCVSPPGRGGKYVWYLYRCVPPSATFARDLGWTGRACSTMSRVGRYERGTYVLCVRLGAGSAHGCAHCTMQRGNCMHAESPMRLRCVSPCGDAFDRRRSTSVDGARGELGSCLSRAHPPTLGIWWSRSRMGMALRVMSRCVSCPRPLPGSCSLIRTMGGQSSLCVSPPGRGGKYVWYLYRCVPPSATFARDNAETR